MARQRPLSNSTLVVDAASIAPAAREWLQQTISASVLHVFDRACNLVNEDAKVLSLVSREIGNGPFSLVIGSRDTVSAKMPSLLDYIGSESKVFPCGEGLTIGALRVMFGSTHIWQPRPAWSRLSDGIGPDFYQLLLAILQECSSRDSLAGLVTGLGRPASIAGAFTGWQILEKGLRAGGPDDIADGASRLAGLGAGLTPAGDDFLLGVIYALWAARPPAKAIAVAETIAAAAIPRTTRLSAAWLESAARGEAGERWHRLIDALPADRSLAGIAASKILQTGHTSGADALAGFLATLPILSTSVSCPD